MTETDEWVHEDDKKQAEGEKDDFGLSAIKLADLLKEVTKVVDVTKGTLQLQMLIYLNDHGPQSAEQISKELGKRRKAVTDALRKLKLKEVVNEIAQTNERSESVIMYQLTDNGKHYVESLRDIFGNKGGSSITTSRATGFRLIELIEEIPLLFNTYDAIIAIGLSGSQGLSSKKLANLFSLSEQRAITYLDLFTDAKGATLFKKKLSGDGSKEEVRYTLSDNGQRILKLLPMYNQLKSSYSFKVLRRITMSVHPRQVYLRTAIIAIFGSVILLVDRVVFPNTPILSAVWIAFLAFLAGVLIIDQLIEQQRE
ncbi:MAG: hypothetical protein ABSF36_06330 [Candidatus Methanomethylicaceae archaeon]|jgi:DNA-binding MarR family transcriptional regulator